MNINWDLINEVMSRAKLTTQAVNPVKLHDKVFKGNAQQVKFFVELEKVIHETHEKDAALDTAVLLIADRDAMVAELQESVKASGVLSMGLGAKRKDAE